MRRAALLLVPLFLFACDREPVAPDVTPTLGATLETLVYTIPDMDWYTSMPCLGYMSPDPSCPSCAADPDHAVHWTASGLTLTDMYLYLPHDQPVHNRWKAQWSDDLQFETPGGDVWKPVPNIYNFNGWATLYDPVNWSPAHVNAHEQLVFERSDGARMKIKNYNHLFFDEEGNPTVRMQVWDCMLTRPGK
jgi:hypothetical protein